MLDIGKVLSKNTKWFVWILELFINLWFKNNLFIIKCKNKIFLYDFACATINKKSICHFSGPQSLGNTKNRNTEDSGYKHRGLGALRFFFFFVSLTEQKQNYNSDYV